MIQWPRPWSTIGILVALGSGCSPPEPLPQGPLLLTRQIRQEALLEAPPRDIRVARRRYSDAVEAFALSGKSLVTSSAPPSDTEMMQILEQFALVLETTPGGNEVGASLAANGMRIQVVEMRLSGPKDSPAVRRAAARALHIGFETLFRLAARSPYRQSPAVNLQADELHDEFVTLVDEELPMEYAGIPALLEHAVLLVKSMLEVSDEPPEQPH